jgi:lactate dehydrogenase-like 2-hydroxyacid dehydrogenase
MKALFLGTLAASQATPIIEFITADICTEILDSNEPAHAAAALADADVLLTGAWRSGFPAAPKLRLLQVPLAGTDGIDVAALPRGVTLCNAYGHEPALGEFAIMMMLAWRHRLFDIATSFREGSWSWSPMVGGAVRGEIGGQTVGVVGLGHIGREVAWRGGTRLPGDCRQPHDARQAGLGRACLYVDGTRPGAWRVRHPRAELCPNPRDGGVD